MCGRVSWVAGLLCAWTVMLGPMGQPVDKREDKSAVAPQMQEQREMRMPTPAPMKDFAVEHSVRQSESLSAAEKEFVLKRKEVALESLNSLGIKSTLASVPHIGLLGSGGGQRAAVGLVGSLYQLEKEGLLDTVLYLGAISGSAWSMSSLYSDPQWSSNLDGAVSRLSGPGVEMEQALAWLHNRSKEEDFSLNDVLGLLTSAAIVKQLDVRHLSEDSVNTSNPYPIYSTVNKNCLQNGLNETKWFEMTPHEVGFTDLGLFINTSHLSSRIHKAHPEDKGLEMDITKLQGIMGSAVSDEKSLTDYMPDWLKGLVGTAATDNNNLLDVVSLWTEGPQQVNSSLDVLNGYHSFLKLSELIRKTTEDPTVLSGLDNLQKTLKENLSLTPTALFNKSSPELILGLWRQSMAPLQTWIQSLIESPIKENGTVGSAVADEKSLTDYMPDWLKGLVGTAATDMNILLDVVSLWTEGPQQVNSSLDVLNGYHSFLKLSELIRKTTEDPTVLSGLDNLQKTLKENLNLTPTALFNKSSPELILGLWRQSMAPLQTWIQSLIESPIKENGTVGSAVADEKSLTDYMPDWLKGLVGTAATDNNNLLDVVSLWTEASWLLQKVFPLIWKWEWGTTENFLYQYTGAVVPSCIRSKQHLQLVDAGVMLNTPYPPFLGEKRDVDLLITLDYGADEPFKTLTLARDYAAAVKKPFPEIDEKILEERDWPKDCYVFEGKEKEPTIVYMPLFNRDNCKDAMDIKAKMKEFSTIQLPFNREKIEFVLETVKANVKNNKETLLREIYKAALRRLNKSYRSSSMSDI